MNTKLVKTIREAIALAGLKDGMTISFHHHLRNGDYVLNLVMDEIAAMGIRDLTVNASALFDTHAPLLDHIKNHVVRKVQTNYISAGIGRQISAGLMDEPVEFRTHGGRPRDIALGITPIDVAFIAAPCSDRMGNCTGKYGRSACGSLGYAFPDAMYAKKVVVITDELAEYPLTGWSIPEIYVDYVVQIDAIGDPAGIVSGTTRMTRNPVALVMAQTAARVIQNSGLLRDGFSFQTGAGGATLATAMYLKQIMLREQIHGSYAQGGITGYLVDMLNEGCFRALMDVQCFDLKAAASIRDNPNHCEVGAAQYASAGAKSSIMDSLDVAVLGATEIDTDFNVNVHTDSSGRIMGGSGGHSDAAAGSKLSIITAPLFRGRLPIVRDRVTCISTPGKDIDVLVTQADRGQSQKGRAARAADAGRDAGIGDHTASRACRADHRHTGAAAACRACDRKGHRPGRHLAGYDRRTKGGGMTMREIRASHITDTVARLCVEANRQLPQDVRSRICAAYADEPWPIAKEVLGRILENADIAAERLQPICQDTGMACVFVELGQEVHIAGDLNEAIHAGVRRGYTDGFLRKSVVRDPLDRVNTGDNTPAMIYYEIVPGDRLKLTVAPKGFGSENMSRIAMLRPSDGLDGVKQFVLDAVLQAGPNPCPPIVVGVGLGGTFDKAALLAKKALLRETGGHNEDPFYAELERELLERINALGIGPQGFGGRTTALAVHMLSMPTHIAGLPVAVNINCHVARHRTEVL